MKMKIGTSAYTFTGRREKARPLELKCWTGAFDIGSFFRVLLPNVPAFPGWRVRGFTLTGAYIRGYIHCMLIPFFAYSRKFNELDTFSYYLYLFLEPSYKLSRILNSTMARIHLFMCSFLISTSQYLSLEVLIQLSTALSNIVIILTDFLFPRYSGNLNFNKSRPVLCVYGATDITGVPNSRFEESIKYYCLKCAVLRVTSRTSGSHVSLDTCT